MKKRLNIEDRIIIQACLENHYKINGIVRRLSVNKSTISREIKKFSYKTNGTKFPCERNCYVCNVCFVKGCCTKVKTYYNYKIAEEKSRNLRIYPRSKPKIANEDIKGIDEIVTDGVKNGKYCITSSFQTDKAFCEWNHELIRYFLPKGKSFDFLTQEIVDSKFSNINSYVRKSKNDKTPYDLFKKLVKTS